MTATTSIETLVLYQDIAFDVKFLRNNVICSFFPAPAVAGFKHLNLESFANCPTNCTTATGTETLVLLLKIASDLNFLLKKNFHCFYPATVVVGFKPSNLGSFANPPPNCPTADSPATLVFKLGNCFCLWWFFEMLIS